MKVIGVIVKWENIWHRKAIFLIKLICVMRQTVIIIFLWDELSLLSKNWKNLLVINVMAITTNIQILKCIKLHQCTIYILITKQNIIEKLPYYLHIQVLFRMVILANVQVTIFMTLNIKREIHTTFYIQ